MNQSKQPSEKPISRLEWADMAEALFQEIKEAPYGQLGELYVRLGEKYRLNPDVARRAVRALRALHEIQAIDGELALHLRTAPLVVAETVARWAKYDKKGALDAGRGYLTGRLLTTALAEAERAARPDRNPYELSVREWRNEVRTFAQGILSAEYPNYFEPLDHQRPKGSLWHLIFVNEDGRRVVVFGPGSYKSESTYLKRMAFVIYAAAAEALKGQTERIIMILPSPVIVSRYRAFFAAQSLERVPIEFMALRK